MPAVTFTLQGAATPARVQAELTVMNLYPKPMAIVLPITDPEAQFKNLEGDWQQIPRPGQKPILARVADKLSTLDLKVTVAAPDGARLDPNNTVEAVLTALTAATATDSQTNPIALTWGSFDSSVNVTKAGYWHIQSLEIDSELRQPVTNNITRAEATITLVEASDPPSAQASSMPSWTRPPAAPAAVATTTVTATIKEWTVSAGDTAYSIARAVYGTAEPGWRLILDANGIISPSSLAPGTALVIPSQRV